MRRIKRLLVLAMQKVKAKAPTPIQGDALLMESGDFLLLENGDKILLET